MSAITNANPTLPWTRSKVGAGCWSADENVSADDIAATLRIADATPEWRVESVSLGGPARGERPAYPTCIELAAGRFRYRYLIPNHAEAKRLLEGSRKARELLGW